MCDMGNMCFQGPERWGYHKPAQLRRLSRKKGKLSLNGQLALDGTKEYRSPAIGYRIGIYGCVVLDWFKYRIFKHSLNLFGGQFVELLVLFRGLKFDSMNPTSNTEDIIN